MVASRTVGEELPLEEDRPTREVSEVEASCLSVLKDDGADDAHLGRSGRRRVGDVPVFLPLSGLLASLVGMTRITSLLLRPITALPKERLILGRSSTWGPPGCACEGMLYAGPSAASRCF